MILNRNNRKKRRRANRDISIGHRAGHKKQGSKTVAIGNKAGRLQQKSQAISIGHSAGRKGQGKSAVAIGFEAAKVGQGEWSIAVGGKASNSAKQGANSILFNASGTSQTAPSKSIVLNATNDEIKNPSVGGTYIQPVRDVRENGDKNTEGILGYSPSTGEVKVVHHDKFPRWGKNGEIWSDGMGGEKGGEKSIGIGKDTKPGKESVSLGHQAGTNNQGTGCIAVGTGAGAHYQGTQSVAMGTNAGNSAQGSQAVSIGRASGSDSQGIGAVAVGSLAGSFGQGKNAVAIGNQSGVVSQAEGSLCIGHNTTCMGVDGGVALNGNKTDKLDAKSGGFFVQPVRSGSGKTVVYDNETKEIMYNPELKNCFNCNSSSVWSSAIGAEIQADEIGKQRFAVAIGNKSVASSCSVSIGAHQSLAQKNQGTASVSIGYEAGRIDQGNFSVAVGAGSGDNHQAAGSVCVGANAGCPLHSENGGVVINGMGVLDLKPNSGGFYVQPVRDSAQQPTPTNNWRFLCYNPDTKELAWMEIN